jgi:hypothetical protein
VSILESLILSAQLSGVSPAGLEAPKFAAAAAKGAPQAVLTLKLADIRVRHDAIETRARVGRGEFGFSLLSGPESLHFIARQDGVEKHWPLAELKDGVSGEFPKQRIGLKRDGEFVRVSPANPPPDAEALVSVPELVDSLYAEAIRIVADIVRYAVVYEDGGRAPAAVSLLRRDSQGMYWISYRPVDRLKSIHYFVAVNGVLYGMRLEGENLVFYAKESDAKTPLSLAAPERPLL